MLTGCWRFIYATGFLSFLLTSALDLASSLDAADATELVRKDLPDHRVVLRLSDELLNSVMDNQDIDRQTDVRETIIGTSIYGKARVIAKPGVKLVESADDATFHITVDGKIYSRTTGYNGPAIIHSRSVTTFTASRPVVFQPGKGFYALPSKVSARTESVVEGISSSWGGLIGRIVCRRARKIEAARHAETTEIARQKAERRIAASFDRSSEQRLARLNKTADFQSLATVALRATGRGEPKYACCTTPDYLQIAMRSGDSGSVIELPESNVAEGAPIEIWVHESLFDNPVSAGIDLLIPQGESSKLMSLLGTAAQRLVYPSDAPGPVRSLLGNQLRTHKVKEWRVVQVDVPNIDGPRSSPKVASAVPSNRPRATKTRIWTSGSFTADAEFLSLQGNIVRLRRNTGIKTSIPIDRLSVSDRVWIQNQLAGNTN